MLNNEVEPLVMAFKREVARERLAQSSRLYSSIRTNNWELKRGKQWPFHKHRDILGSSQQRSARQTYWR